MESDLQNDASVQDELRAVIQTHWGYSVLRPLQDEAMAAMLGARDSVVVMPTGGGKSLCYQAPALVRAKRGLGPTVVVSPLISLMKDQVDSLRANGIPAAQLDSSLSNSEKNGVAYDLKEGNLRLLFVSPERLVMAGFQAMLREAGVSCFAIDEAHCISHWGHDFRPEYRQLALIKEWFPGASVHAFTATATEGVREDIAKQLNLVDPTVLVGNFDRPNLTYRITGRRNEMGQVLEVLKRHKDEAGIIYCLRRKDVDALTHQLNTCGYKALAYHAGMTPDQRRKAQEAFAGRSLVPCDLIVATVAFGMGIDRSDIRFIVHTAMPKSVEAYQQEIGRAGRDGLEAECVLLYSGQDRMIWRSIIERSASEAEAGGVEIDPGYVPHALGHVEDMDRYCRGAVCRHRALVEYFGQAYVAPVEEEGDAEIEGGSCGACDHCLGDTEVVAGALVIAQKILSCVARVNQRFGVGHVIAVLRGAQTERVKKMGHDQLPTYGLLAEHAEGELRDFIFQLISQKVLVQEAGEYPILTLNPASWEVMKGLRPVRLIQPVNKKTKEERPSKQKTVSWEGVDQELFESLRGLRRNLALGRNVPPYVIFSDATLRELARKRPGTLGQMRLVYGIGETKLRDFGDDVLQVIVAHCQRNNVALDVAGEGVKSKAKENKPVKITPNGPKDKAFKLFGEGASIEDTAAETGRSRPTIVEYLCQWIQAEKPQTVEAWVSKKLYQQIKPVALEVGVERLKPIFVALGESVDYDVIRIVVTHMGCGGNGE